MKYIKLFENFIAEADELKDAVNLLSEAKVKTDNKSYRELSQAIDKADEVSDIWNQLDPKLFPMELEEFEDIFDKWWDANASSYNTIKEFVKNATKSDVESLLAHIAKNKK